MVTTDVADEDGSITGSGISDVGGGGGGAWCASSSVCGEEDSRSTTFSMCASGRVPTPLAPRSHCICVA